MKNIFLIPLALVVLSCQGPMVNEKKKAPNSDADKAFVLVKDWSQDAQGNLTIHYTAKVLIDAQWSFLTVGFWGTLSDGMVYAYDTIDNPVPLKEYSGTATTDYSRGSTILDVGPYNIVYGVKY